MAALKITPLSIPLSRKSPAIAITTDRRISVGRNLFNAKPPIRNAAPTPNQTPPMNRMWLSWTWNVAASEIEMKSRAACQPSVFIPPRPTFSPRKMMAAPTITTTEFSNLILFTSKFLKVAQLDDLFNWYVFHINVCLTAQALFGTRAKIILENPNHG
jgi:hypothetical protein